MDKRPIGVFDSGVGGLSILKELRKLLPHEDFIFLADQKHLPYGTKSKREIIALSSKNTGYLLGRNIKLLVVACNTASCYALEALRKKHNFPIIGTVPAIKPASERTQTGAIAIISTPATAKSQILKDLVKKYAQGVKVLNISCPGLVKRVEMGERDNAQTRALLEKYLKKVKNSPADQLVLGCTHYPFLKEAIRGIVGPKVAILDSGEAIARRTQAVLREKKLLNRKKTPGVTRYLTTGKSERRVHPRMARLQSVSIS